MNDPFGFASMTDEQIVERGLGLARMFYEAHGYEADEGFKFYEGF